MFSTCSSTVRHKKIDPEKKQLIYIPDNFLQAEDRRNGK
jgi:hypothetical protein